MMDGFHIKGDISGEDGSMSLGHGLSDGCVSGEKQIDGMKGPGLIGDFFFHICWTRVWL
jgi:hypothetical protein